MRGLCFDTGMPGAEVTVVELEGDVQNPAASAVTPTTVTGGTYGRRGEAMLIGFVIGVKGLPWFEDAHHGDLLTCFTLRYFGRMFGFSLPMEWGRN